jgi:hypothetical protein
MSKDPAFLFYPTDFMGMVMNFDNEETGMFIKLLCLQFFQGHYTEEDIMRITGYAPTERLFNKLTVDAQGYYFNEWLEERIIKRRKYAESRRKNRQGKKKKKEIEDSC